MPIFCDMAMFSLVIKTLSSKCRLSIKRICDAILDPDLLGFIMDLLEFTGINNYAINLANEFIRPSKSPVGNLILFFLKKRRKSLVPILIVYNWQIFKSPGLYWMLCFIQLDWSAHYGKKICESKNLKTIFWTHNGQLKYQTIHIPILFSGLH